MLIFPMVLKTSVAVSAKQILKPLLNYNGIYTYLMSMLQWDLLKNKMTNDRLDSDPLFGDLTSFTIKQQKHLGLCEQHCLQKKFTRIL